MRRGRAIVAATLVALLFAAAFLVVGGTRDGGAPPSLADVRASWCPSDVRVLDRSGKPLHTLRLDEHGRRLAWTPLAAVSPALVRAVLASEDRRFEEHGGVDWRAACAAAWQRATGGPARGASTISMQLAALLNPSLRRGAAPRGLAQKWRQMQAAWRIEAHWTKREILEAYLNLVSWRGEVRGVRAAADAVYGKEPGGLTEAEGIVLAASLRAPNAGRAVLLSRARTLRDSEETGTARRADLEEAVEALVGRPDARGPRIALAPHASRRLVASREPRHESPNGRQDGPHVEPCRDIPSSLDLRLQRIAIASLREHLLQLQDRSAGDGAVLVVDNATGEVLAYVGSSGDLSASRDVDGVRARRQAGSTLKPFLYASAIERALVTPATLLEDTPLEITADGRIYRPDNYDHLFRGLVSVRTALASSLNVPAVRTLLLVGADAFAATLRQFGLAGVTERGDWYGPSLALGSADVSLWELVGAYRALARGGEWSELTLQPESPLDESARRIFTPATAALVADILSDRGSRATTFDLAGPLATRYWSAVKTGTSKDMRDNWCVGFSRRYTVGVWVGNFSGAPMHDVSGITGAAPVWRDVMDALHVDEASDAPALPEGVVTAWTMFAGGAEPAREELYLRGTEPTSASAPLASRPRIAEPADGAVIAIDPDIPPSRQRVAFVAHDAGDGATWRLDRTALGSACEPQMWQPVRGAHELELVDREGRRLDVLRFLVKGPVEAVQTAGNAGAMRGMR